MPLTLLMTLTLLIHNLNNELLNNKLIKSESVLHNLKLLNFNHFIRRCKQLLSLEGRAGIVIAVIAVLPFPFHF